jgi:hypothetical protein
MIALSSFGYLSGGSSSVQLSDIIISSTSTETSSSSKAPEYLIYMSRIENYSEEDRLIDPISVHVMCESPDKNTDTASFRRTIRSNETSASMFHNFNDTDRDQYLIMLLSCAEGYKISFKVCAPPPTTQKSSRKLFKG